MIHLKIPIRLRSEANMGGKLRDKFRRKKQYKNAVDLFWNAYVKEQPELPVTVTFYRGAPRMLDEEDNLRMAFKWIKDHAADKLVPGLAPGHADGDKRLKFAYGQEISEEYYIRIIISHDV